MSSDPGRDNLFQRLKDKIAGDEDKLQSRDDLRREIDRLHQQRVLSDSESLMLQGILAFQNKTVREVMVPRLDAFMVDENVDFQTNLDEILRQPYSRVPVYRQDKDKIIGVIHIRTVLKKARAVGFAHLDYDEVMTQPLFVPETASLSELLLEMQQTQQQLAILLDGYGGVVGLATIEDLIEEIVGNIDDEVDQAQVLLHRLDKNHYVIYGKMPLDDFNERFGANLQMNEVDTVAGYVIHKLGLIPAKDQLLHVKLDNWMTLTTGRMKGSRLLTLLLTISPGKKKEEHKG